MQKFLLLGIFIICGLFVFSQTSKAQKNITIGVVDVESVVKELPEAVDADKQLTELQKRFNDTLVKSQENLYKKAEQYQKQKSMMPADQQAKTEESLKAEEQMLYKFRQDKYTEIQQKRDEFLEPIRQKVKRAIAEVAKQEGMSYVLDKGNPAVLYYEDKFDITFSVIDKIKRGNAGAIKGK